MKDTEIKIGDYVQYYREPQRALQVVSTPYTYNGQAVVTCRRGNGHSADQMIGMYAIDALTPWPGPMPGAGGFPPRPGVEGSGKHGQR